MFHVTFSVSFCGDNGTFALHGATSSEAFSQSAQHVRLHLLMYVSEISHGSSLSREGPNASSHLSNYISWCTDAMCLLMLRFREKSLSHCVHLYGFLLWCTAAMCVVMFCLVEKLLSQCAHLYGFCCGAQLRRASSCCSFARSSCRIASSCGVSAFDAQLQCVSSCENCV